MAGRISTGKGAGLFPVSQKTENKRNFLDELAGMAETHMASRSRMPYEINNLAID